MTGLEAETADQLWLDLLREYGRPLGVSEVEPSELARAFTDDRVLLVETWRDGFGGGSVVFSVARPPESDGGKGGEVKRSRTLVPAFSSQLVFPARVRLDDDLIARLNRNTWESESEMPR